MTVDPGAGLNIPGHHSPPANAIQVAQLLGELSRRLDELVNKIAESDHIATVLKEEYLRAYARAWASACGSVEGRKQIAIGLTSEPRLAAEVADAEVRDLRRRIDALKTRIDVGRSYGAAVRAESELVRSPFSPYGS